MPRRRMGRPGLVGTMARTAVIAGTATAVVGAVGGKQEARAQQQAAAQQARMTAPPPPVVAAPAEDEGMAKIAQLGEMHAKGLLTDEEFAAAKAKILGI
jgi:Short C-terminal domain